MSAALDGGGVVFAAYAQGSSESWLDSSVLMLNAHYVALRIVSVRRAFTLLFKRGADASPVAEVVAVEAGRYVSYDFEQWVEFSVLHEECGGNGVDWVQAVRHRLAVPRVIRVLTFSKFPGQEIKFNRRSVFARDGYVCQYCGKRFPVAELSLDHVIPRSRGGSTTWENIVSACLACNVRKGGRTPAEARLCLGKPPVKPRRNPAVAVKLNDRRYASWKHFVSSTHADTG